MATQEQLDFKQIMKEIKEQINQLIQIKELIDEAKEESLLCPTQYSHRHQDGSSGVKWTMVNKSCNILSKINNIINKS